MVDFWSVLNDVMRTDPWFAPFSTPAANTRPTVIADVAETDAEYWIEAELPGVSLDNVRLAIESGVLTLTVDKRLGSDADTRNYHHVERRYGTFSRAFRLPNGVDTDQVQATMKDGVLRIRVPKSEHARPRRIPVRVGTLGPGEAAPRQITVEASETDDE
jgi:HSP20 family protein